MNKPSVILALTTVLLFAGQCCSSAKNKEDPVAMNYTPLVVVNDHGIVTKASGIIISERQVLTSFHVLEEGTKVAAPNGKPTSVPGQTNATIGSVEACDPYLGWAILNFGEDMFLSHRLRYAKTILVGESVFAVTNAYGMDGIFLIASVAKVDDKRVYFYPAFPKGSSGAALYMRDEKGNPVFIGMVQGELRYEGGDGVGYALRARNLKPIILKHTRPPRPNIVPFPDASEAEPR